MKKNSKTKYHALICNGIHVSTKKTVQTRIKIEIDDDKILTPKAKEKVENGILSVGKIVAG